MEKELDTPTLESLHKLLSVFDQQPVTPQHVADAFGKVIEHVKTTQKLTVQHLETITQAVKKAAQDLATGNQSQISALRDQLVQAAVDAVGGHVAALHQSHQEALARLDTAIAGIKNGKDADEEAIFKRLAAKIPPPQKPPQADHVRTYIEGLKGNDRIDKSAIRGLDELENKVNSVAIVGNMGTGVADSTGHIGRFQYLKFPGATISTVDDTATVTIGGGGGAGTVYTETPSGAVDGTNTTYSVQHAPGSIFSFVFNGQFIHPGDYSISGTTVTFTSPLPAIPGAGFTIVYSATGTSSAYSETPAGAVDGSNATYTTSHTITAVLAFAINGEFIHPGDYSVSGSTITFTSPLPGSLSTAAFTIIYI